MMSEGVKETLCTCCAHRDVCVYKPDYLHILKSIEDISIIKEFPDGNASSKKIASYDFISEISVGCRYYRHWTDMYRGCKKNE